MAVMHLAVLICCLAAVSGFQSFRYQIPNGFNVKHPCDARNPPGRQRSWGAVGHMNVGHTAEKNLFGQAWQANEFKWNRTICEKDSDGDGKSNGEELGDPNCVWEFGLEPEKQPIGHPGFCDAGRSTCMHELGSFSGCPHRVRGPPNHTLGRPPRPSRPPFIPRIKSEPHPQSSKSPKLRNRGSRPVPAVPDNRGFQPWQTPSGSLPFSGQPVFSPASSGVGRRTQVDPRTEPLPSRESRRHGHGFGLNPPSFSGGPSGGMPSGGMPLGGVPSGVLPTGPMPSGGMLSDGMPSDGMPSGGLLSDFPVFQSSTQGSSQGGTTGFMDMETGGFRSGTSDFGTSSASTFGGSPVGERSRESVPTLVPSPSDSVSALGGDSAAMVPPFFPAQPRPSADLLARQRRQRMEADRIRQAIMMYNRNQGWFFPTASRTMVPSAYIRPRPYIY